MNEITLEAKIENIGAVRAFLHEKIDKYNCSGGTVMQLEIAIEEIFTNISGYAYGDKTGTADIRIETTDNPASASITFIDSGVPYNPLEKDDTDITLAIEDRPIGGLGIFMVKKTMDEISYEYKDGKNMLTIKKLLK